MAFRAAEYQRFTGSRSRMPVWWPVCTATMRRGWSSLWVKILTLGSLAIAFGFTALFYFAYQVMPNWPLLLQIAGKNEGMDSGFPIEVYAGLLHIFVYPILLPLSLLFGYDLISKDLASNALETYFSRPVTPIAYVLGRTLAYVAFLLLVTLVPMLWIWIFDVSTGPEGRFEEISQVPLALVKGLLPVSVVLALFIQAVSSLTRSGVWTNLTVVVLFFFGFVAGQILYEESGGQVEIELSAEETAELAEVKREHQAQMAESETGRDRVVTRTGPDGERIRIVVRAENQPGVLGLDLSEAVPGPAQIGLTLALFTYASGADWRTIILLTLVPAMMVPEGPAGDLAREFLGQARPFEKGFDLAVLGGPHSESKRIVTYHDPRMLAVSITEDIRAWCVGCLEATYPEDVKAKIERRRLLDHRQTERIVPLGLALQILAGLGGLSLLLLFLRLRKRGMVG